MVQFKRKGNNAEDAVVRQPQKRVRVGAEEDKGLQKKRASDALEASSKRNVNGSKSSTNATPKASELSVLRDDEPSFPRGGASVLTPLERKQIQIQATKDVLFEQKGSTKTHSGLNDSDEDADVEMNDTTERTLEKRPRKKKTKSHKSPEQGASEKQSARIEGLSFKVL